MFGIGRLNGNNLRLGSIDLTTSQMYTGILPSPTAMLARMELIIRIVYHLCAAILLR